MANYRLLSDLRDEILAISDMEIDSFITQEFLDSQINRSVEELWDMVIDGSPRTLTQHTETTTIADDPLLGVPTGMYQLMGIDYKISDHWIVAEPLDFARRNDQQVSGSWGLYSKVFFQETVGEQVEFFPTPASVHPVRFWWIASPTLLIDAIGDPLPGFPPSDLINFPNGWASWVVWNVVQTLKTKAEDDISEAAMKKAELKERILRAAKKRNRTGLRTRDVRGSRTVDYEDSYGWRW